jgi:hypothetical protein
VPPGVAEVSNDVLVLQIDVFPVMLLGSGLTVKTTVWIQDGEDV